MTGYVKSSPYYQTPIKNYYVTYLDYLTYRPIPADATDDVVIVSMKFNHRPDLLSNYLYGTPNLWWVFAARNKNELFDPIYDLKTGIEIAVPKKTRLLSLLGL